MADNTPRKSVYTEMAEIFNRYAADIRQIADKHNDVIGYGVDLDKNTNTPYIFIEFQKGSKQDISDIPSAIGNDKIPVKVKYGEPIVIPIVLLP